MLRGRGAIPQCRGLRERLRQDSPLFNDCDGLRRRLILLALGGLEVRFLVLELGLECRFEVVDVTFDDLDSLFHLLFVNLVSVILQLILVVLEVLLE